MDAWHFTCAVAGALVGWWGRSQLVDKEDPPPCNCHCNCHYSTTALDNPVWFPQTGIWLTVVVGGLILLANLAVAFKITVVNKAGEKELAVAWAPQQKGGKSRGVFGSSKGLTILG